MLDQMLRVLEAEHQTLMEADAAAVKAHSPAMRYFVVVPLDKKANRHRATVYVQVRVNLSHVPLSDTLSYAH